MSSLGLIIGAIGASAVWRGISPTLDGWTLLVVGGVLFSESAARKIVTAVKSLDGRLQNDSVGRRHSLPPMRKYLGKTDATHNKSASGTVSLWGGTPGSETDTGIDVSAYNKFANVGSGKFVWVEHNGHGWYLTGMEC